MAKAIAAARPSPKAQPRALVAAFPPGSLVAGRSGIELVWVPPRGETFTLKATASDWDRTRSKEGGSRDRNPSGRRHEARGDHHPRLGSRSGERFLRGSRLAARRRLSRRR